MPRLFPTLTATRVQASTYLLGIALFSISFLVFLNSSISFVVTDVIGQTHAVGDAVGTLGFADELLALVACPLWGLLSDRLGVRTVAVCGYVIVGCSLVGLVQSRNVYPELLVGRLGFSVGGAACSTMVTAILPAMTMEREEQEEQDGAIGRDGARAGVGAGTSEDRAVPRRREGMAPRDETLRHSVATSISSELTITPARFESQSRSRSRGAGRNQRRATPAKEEDASTQAASGASEIAGYVGMFTGLGALIAVFVFLPLPARISAHGTSRALAVQESFYIVAAIAFAVAIAVAVGLRGLPGEEGKGLPNLLSWGRSSHSKDAAETETGATTTPRPVHSYAQLLLTSLRLGVTDLNIALAYLGGFVARASSVAISLFIPLFVNAYFLRSGLCHPSGRSDIKENCRRAYTVAAMLTGISQLVALLCAPIFGWLNARAARRGSTFPLQVAAAAGIAGALAFGVLDNPDPFAEGDEERKGQGKWAILAVILLGIGQIGAIVCSLGLLSKGIQTRSGGAATGAEDGGGTDAAGEAAPLLGSRRAQKQTGGRAHLKGSVAGVYSLAGGAGILLLTKLGGYLFDVLSPGAPLFMLAAFNAVLLLTLLVAAVVPRLRTARLRQDGDGDEAA